MSKRLLFGTIGITVLCVAALVSLMAGLRNHQEKVFQRPRRLQTALGTNYVLRLVETAVGRKTGGYLVMVTVETENPNSFEVNIPRREFSLKDRTGCSYEPLSNGSEKITLPGRETLSFALPDSALEGELAFRGSPSHWVQLRADHPYRTRLREGEFRAYHRSDW